MGETLLWSGQPKKGIVFRTIDIFLIPFSLLWAGGVIGGFTAALSSDAPPVIALFAIPFVLAGLFMVFGRFLIDAKMRAKTFYGLTDDRIIIKSGLFTTKIKSLNIRSLSDIEYDEKNDGSGTITVGPKNPMMMFGNGMRILPGANATPSLEMIQNVRKVYNQIIEIQRRR